MAYSQQAMQGHPSHSSPQYTAPTPAKHYPTAHSTSSAFSASANPNEDWTKISDLAERRRIQNRIAQRNYRKKLKKRLEDLERRAASSSASPEQRHEELAQPDSRSSDSTSRLSPSRQSLESSQASRWRTRDYHAQPHIQNREERGMFSTQYTRQLSTSPPPFSYPPSHSQTEAYASYPPLSACYSMPPFGTDMPLFPTLYLPPIQQHYSNYLPSMTQQNKQDIYSDEEISPFSISYASMAGIDSSLTQTYHDTSAHTPPLSDSFDYSQGGSPPELTYPRTPSSMPTTPPMRAYDRS